MCKIGRGIDFLQDKTYRKQASIEVIQAPKFPFLSFIRSRMVRRIDFYTSAKTVIFISTNLICPSLFFGPKPDDRRPEEALITVYA
jgi:hypothetical protein